MGVLGRMNFSYPLSDALIVMRQLNRYLDLARIQEERADRNDIELRSRPTILPTYSRAEELSVCGQLF